MKNNVEQWIEMVNKNKEIYSEKVNNTDILLLRQQASECGFEMTPSEVKSYIAIINSIIQN